MKLIFGSLTLDLERLCLIGPAGPLKLRPKSFEVLRYLAEHAGQTVAVQIDPSVAGTLCADRQVLEPGNVDGVNGRIDRWLAVGETDGRQVAMVIRRAATRFALIAAMGHGPERRVAR